MEDEKMKKDPVNGEGMREENAAREAPREEEVVVEATAEDVEALQNRLLDAQSRLDKTAKELEDTKNVFQRTLAEYDNFRKRTAKEKSETFNNGVITAVTGIIPVIDTLEMALSAPTSDENFKKGIEMTLTAAKSALKGLGVEEIDALGQPFDPKIHSAVMQEEKEGVEAGTVIAQFQKGYRIQDKVIRPAAVSVSR